MLYNKPNGSHRARKYYINLNCIPSFVEYPAKFLIFTILQHYLFTPCHHISAKQTSRKFKGKLNENLSNTKFNKPRTALFILHQIENIRLHFNKV